MNLSKKNIAIGLVLLIIVWTGNIFYYKKHVLKEPVFLKHYYDFSQGRGRFDLRYIQNIKSKDKVMTIVFPELGEEYVDFQEYNNNSDRRYYQIKSIGINLHQDDWGNLPEEYRNKVITKAEIQFSSGKVMNVNIGKIYLSSGKKEEYVLKTHGSSGSSDNSGSASFAIDKDLKIKAIHSNFPDIINDALDVRINEKPIKDINFPIVLKEGDKLDIDYKFKFNKDDIRRNSSYDFPIDIVVEDSKGNKGFGSCFVNYWLQFPQDIDINALINNKGRE